MWLNMETGNSLTTWPLTASYLDKMTTIISLFELNFAAYSNQEYENLTLYFILIPSLLLLAVLTLVDVLQDLEEFEKDADNVDVERKSGKNVLLW